MPNKQLTQEELTEFQNYRVEISKLATALGELHYQRTLIDLELDNVKEAIKANSDKQRAQLEVLGKKYGDGSIDVTTGEITPIEG